jgi:hypothetical protein
MRRQTFDRWLGRTLLTSSSYYWESACVYFSPFYQSTPYCRKIWDSEARTAQMYIPPIVQWVKLLWLVCMCACFCGWSCCAYCAYYHVVIIIWKREDYYHFSPLSIYTFLPQNMTQRGRCPDVLYSVNSAISDTLVVGGVCACFCGWSCCAFAHIMLLLLF